MSPCKLQFLHRVTGVRPFSSIALGDVASAETDSGEILPKAAPRALFKPLLRMSSCSAPPPVAAAASV